MRDATDITVVLDRSGSMMTAVNDTIGGFNKFLADQKAQPGAATITLNQFDHEHQVVYAGKPVAEAPELTNKTYVPRGNTALLDSIGRSIVETGTRLSAIPESDRPNKVIFVIITDGEENASKEYTRERVFEMINHQSEAYKWQFVFLAANQDAIGAGAGMGIKGTMAMSYAQNTAGTKSAWISTSANVRALRSGQAGGYTQADRDAQKAAGSSH